MRNIGPANHDGELLESGARLAEKSRQTQTSILGLRGCAQHSELVVEIGDARYVAQLESSICFSET
jgi:hypothetical protein